MTADRLNRVTLSLDHFPGVFEGEELRALLGEFAVVREVEPLLDAYDGDLLRCAGLETFEDEDGPGVRVGDVAFVAAGQVVRAGPLTCHPARGARHVFVDWSVSRSPLAASRHLGIAAAAAALTADRESAAANRYELLRLTWPGGRPAVDADWWPNVARVGADPRSAAAARKLMDLFPAGSPERRWFAGRLTRTTWELLIPSLLRAAVPVLPAGPTGTGPAGEESVPAFVGALLAVAGARMPAEHDGGRLVQVLQPETTRAAGRKTIYHFTGEADRPREARLAVRVTTAAAVSHVILSSACGTYERPVAHDAVSVVGAVGARAAFVLKIADGKLAGAALYDGNPRHESD